MRRPKSKEGIENILFLFMILNVIQLQLIGKFEIKILFLSEETGGEGEPTIPRSLNIRLCT